MSWLLILAILGGIFAPAPAIGGHTGNAGADGRVPSPAHVADAASGRDSGPSGLNDRVTASVTVPAASSDTTVRGWSTWYRWHPGQAAAGPALRKALGSDWRGSVVTVCADGCTDVRLTDWCVCGSRHGVPTVIDLDLASFDAIGDPGAGVIRVSVSFSGGRIGASPTLPPTDTSEKP